MSSDEAEQDALGRLGRGGEGDQLSLRTVLEIAWRGLPYLKPVIPDLLRFAAVAIPVSIVLAVGGFFGLDLFFNRTLIGDPLTPFSAMLLSLDPSDFVEVEKLSHESRRLLLMRLAVIAVSAVLIMIPLVIGALYFRVMIRQRVNQHLRLEMMQRLQALSLQFHAEHQSGDSIYRIYQDSAMVTGIIEALFIEPLYRVFVALLGLAVAFAFDPILALLIVVTSLGMLLLGMKFSGALRRGFRRAREANSALTSRIQMSFSGIRVAKAYGFTAQFQEQFEDASLHAFEMAFVARRRWVVYGILAFTVSGIGLIGAEGFMALQAGKAGETYAAKAFVAIGFSIWNLGAFTAARQRLGSSARGLEDLANIWARTQEMAVGLDRAFQILDLEPDVEEAADAVEVPAFRESIRFQDVDFSYEPGRPVLQAVNLTFKPGQVTAIVGPTGSGKSTLLSLLLRLFDPDRGSISIDGVDLRRFKISSLRSAVSVALQENILFATTIRENIAYAAPDADDDTVRNAAALAALDEFIDSTRAGLDFELGERGSRLSTGQRQRIGIARAVIKDSPILILDEPTAALDARTERIVMDRLSAWGEGRAIILITHRLSTIRAADQIVFLSAGRVLESGSHEELMALGDGAYRRMVELEEEAFVEATPEGSDI